MSWFHLRAAGRDDEALYREALAHLDTLYGFAHSLARNPDDAHDLVQETYARALETFDRYDLSLPMRPWLMRILRNTFLDQERRRRRAPTESLPADDAEFVEPARTDDELSRMRGLVARDLERALHQLPEEQRTAVLLDLEGLTEVEVAAVMGCAVGTVKSRLARGRASLRNLLLDYASS